MFYAKFYPQGVLAFADEDLMDKTFEEGDFILKITPFFGTSLVSKEDLRRLIDDARTINAVGKFSVKLLMELDLCSEKSIRFVDNVPHVQIFMMSI